MGEWPTFHMGLELKEQEENSTVPKMAFYKVDKIHPNPHTQPLIKGKAAFTILVNSMPSSFSNAPPECPAEGVSRRYLIKRKLFHFNTPQTVGAWTVAPSHRHRRTMNARHGLSERVHRGTGSSYSARWSDQKFRLFCRMVKWTLCSSESKRKAPGITSLCCLLNSPFVSKRV